MRAYWLSQNGLYEINGDCIRMHQPRTLSAEQADAWANGYNAATYDLIQKIEAEARRYAEMYQPSSDGRNTFTILADWIASLSDSRQRRGKRE